MTIKENFNDKRMKKIQCFVDKNQIINFLELEKGGIRLFLLLEKGVTLKSIKHLTLNLTEK